MVAVNAVDGIKYGFRLIGYLIAVGLIGGGIMFVGFLLVGDENFIIGGILSLIGYLVFFAGQFGIIYKIIADGVSTGVSDAGMAVGGGGGQQYQGGQNQQYQGGQGQQYQGQR